MKPRVMGYRKSHYLSQLELTSIECSQIIPNTFTQWGCELLAGSNFYFIVTSAPCTIPKTQKLHNTYFFCLKMTMSSTLKNRKAIVFTNYLERCVSFHCTEHAKYTKPQKDFLLRKTCSSKPQTLIVMQTDISPKTNLLYNLERITWSLVIQLDNQLF